jgi:DNA mismatch repair protein MSH2
MPVAEAASRLVAEIDVLVSFATVAALAPVEYVRPTVRPKGSGILRLERARHPCVELMDRVDFIPNDYHFVKGESQFQIVTGPNMGKSNSPYNVCITEK